MDITAHFLSDMGIPVERMAVLRETFRKKISQEPVIMAFGKTTEDDRREWLGRLDFFLQERISDSVRQQFYAWVKDTFTTVPADRPNWERYEMFFHQWSVGMRTMRDTAGCFTDPQGIYEAYHAFVPSRMLKMRIQEGTRRKLSPWDAEMFGLRRYSVLEDDWDSAEYFDPFGVVYATANRNYFQQFWEYLFPQLAVEERTRLYDAMWEHYRRTTFLTELLPPERLTRGAR
jgi:hypothetical protein